MVASVSDLFLAVFLFLSLFLLDFDLDFEKLQLPVYRRSTHLAIAYNILPTPYSFSRNISSLRLIVSTHEAS